MSTVSVILPNYNHAQYLPLRIESILNQTYQDFELIILDDYSTDNSKEVIERYREYPKITKIIFNEENSGSTFKQWNKGIDLAKGEYIWIAESDDWAEPSFLETLVAEFEKDENVGLVYCHSKVIDAQGNISNLNESQNTSKYIVCSGKSYINVKLSFGNSIGNASMMMFRRGLFPSTQQQELYSNMIYCGDWMFYVLLAEKEIKVVEIKKTLNNYRIHKKNVSTNAIAQGKGFTEGLDVYLYVKRKFGVNINIELMWAKKLFKAKKNNLFSKEIMLFVLNKLRSEHKVVYILYYLIKPIYILKSLL